MFSQRQRLIAAAIIALAASPFAATSRAAAHEHHDSAHHGHDIGPPHGEHRQPQHDRKQARRHLFTHFTPCVVWTRQGWTHVCSTPN